MSIHTIVNKIKGEAGRERQTLVFVGILAAACIVSFYMGYVAKAEASPATPVVIQCPDAAYIDAEALSTVNPTKNTKQQSVNTGTGEYVASKNGTKYYTPGCAGASRIKDENKVFFKTAQEAEAAGYGIAAGCK